jgi:uncharacterized protein
MKSTAKTLVRPATPSDVAARVDAIDWAQATGELDAQGCAVLKGLLSRDECGALAAFYPDDKHFRSRIVMGRHGFGRGEYKYFSYPLPNLIAELRPPLYAQLRGVANRWNEAMGIDIRYPETHEAFLKRCHAAGQTRPTPLLLQYGPGDYNCLHQDLYGAHVFLCRPRSCCRNLAAISAAANSCSPNSGRECSRGPKWCRSRRAMRWLLPCITGRYRGRAGSIALICVMA